VKPGTLLRLAVAGTRTDTMRIVLTAFGAVLGTLALLSAATVRAIPTIHDPAHPDETPYAPYTNGLLREPGLRPGLAIALILLALATGLALSSGIARPTVASGGHASMCTAPPADPDACASRDPAARGATVVVAPDRHGAGSDSLAGVGCDRRLGAGRDGAHRRPGPGFPAGQHGAGGVAYHLIGPRSRRRPRQRPPACAGPAGSGSAVAAGAKVWVGGHDGMCTGWTRRGARAGWRSGRSRPCCSSY
jgi:hypothetical protein